MVQCKKGPEGRCIPRRFWNVTQFQSLHCHVALADQALGTAGCIVALRPCATARTRSVSFAFLGHNIPIPDVQPLFRVNATDFVFLGLKPPKKRRIDFQSPERILHPVSDGSI